MKKILMILLIGVVLSSCSTSKQIKQDTFKAPFENDTSKVDILPQIIDTNELNYESVQSEKPKWLVKKEHKLDNKKHRRETRANKQIAKAEISADKKVDIVKEKEDTKQNKDNKKADTKQNKQDNKSEIKQNKHNNKGIKWWLLILVFAFGFFFKQIGRFLIRFVSGL